MINHQRKQKIVQKRRFHLANTLINSNIRRTKFALFKIFIIAAGKNYGYLIDDDGKCNNSRPVMKWTISSTAIEHTVSTISELNDISDMVIRNVLGLHRRSWMYLC